MIHVRRAGALDTATLADLLNHIIATGGTTAMTDPVTGDELRRWMTRPGAIWHLAEDDSGAPLGFQWTEPASYLPPEACDIASFVAQGRWGIGIGTALFDHSRKAARVAGHRWINAVIRADNTGGLAYYQSRGFEPYRHDPDVTLGDGTVTSRVWMRHDLR